VLSDGAAVVRKDSAAVSLSGMFEGVTPDAPAVVLAGLAASAVPEGSAAVLSVIHAVVHLRELSGAAVPGDGPRPLVRPGSGEDA
jgi:hypothetical protein